MFDMIFNEFQSSLDDICEYFNECDTNYVECAETIILEGGPYVRQRLQYLNEQADEKEEKGINLIIQKFKEFIAKLAQKIRDLFTSMKFNIIEKTVNSDKKLQNLKCTIPNPKAFEKFIAMRRKASDNVVKKLKKRKMAVTKAEFDDMVDEEFKKLDKMRTNLIRNTISISAGVLVGWISHRIRSNELKKIEEQADAEMESIRTQARSGMINLANYATYARATNNEDLYNQAKREAIDLKRQYDTKESIYKNNKKVRKLSHAMDVAIDGGNVTGVLNYIISRLTRGHSITANIEANYIEQACKILSNEVLKSKGNKNIVNNHAVYSFN